MIFYMGEQSASLKGGRAGPRNEVLDVPSDWVARSSECLEKRVFGKRRGDARLKKGGRILGRRRPPKIRACIRKQKK